MGKSVNDEIAGLPGGGGAMLPLGELDSAGIIMSPMISGQDLTAEVDLTSINWNFQPFIMNRSGVVSEIHFIAQGNGAGGGGTRNFKWGLYSITQEASAAASTGFVIDTVLGEGSTTISDQASGDVTVASGLSVEVPKTFVLGLHGASTFTGTEKVRAQRGIANGSFPGLMASVTSATLYAAPSWLGIVDLADPPASQVPGATMGVSPVPTFVSYLKWK